MQRIALFSDKKCSQIGQFEINYNYNAISVYQWQISSFFWSKPCARWVHHAPLFVAISDVAIYTLTTIQNWLEEILERLDISAV